MIRKHVVDEEKGKSSDLNVPIFWFSVPALFHFNH